MSPDAERAIALTATPAVYGRGGIAYASSRDIAAFFGKQHGHVMRDIKALIAGAPSIASNFGAVDYRDAKGELRPAYEMTRNGFTLLAMGFTGKTALAFKAPHSRAKDFGPVGWKPILHNDQAIRTEFHRRARRICPGRVIL